MKNIVYIILCALLFTECKKEDMGNSLIDTSTPIQNETDKWIHNNYTQEFNIEVKYRWDMSELEQSSILTPPRTSQVKPFLDNMKKTWIEPYARHSGMDFVKTYIPKLIVLVGSQNKNNEGAFILGQAEAGRKVTIYEINYISYDFDGLSEREAEKQMKTIIQTLRTMHHEFGHILHMTTAYPVEYSKITPNYIRNWQNFTDGEANRMGFITSYSMLNPNEDFVEFLSIFLTTSNSEWNKKIEEIVIRDDEFEVDEKASAVPRALIRQKEKMLSDYMMSVWKTDIYALQKDISDIIENLRKK